MEWLPTVTKCFCMRVKTTSLLIGHVSIQASCLTMMWLSVATRKLSQAERRKLKEPNPEHTAEEVERIVTIMYIQFMYCVAVHFYNVVINKILINGVNEYNHIYLKIYIRGAFLFIALALSVVVLSFFYMGWVLGVIMLVWAAITIMFIIVAQSTYLQFEATNQMLYEVHLRYIREILDKELVEPLTV